MVKYIRLLSYTGALTVIDFVDSTQSSDNYANITPGGLCVNVNEKDWELVLNFIQSLNTRFEVTDEHPMAVESRIVKDYKLNNLI